jgi:hypothetical protein
VINKPKAATVWDLHNGAIPRWQTFDVAGHCKIVIRDDLRRHWQAPSVSDVSVVSDDLDDDDNEVIPRQGSGLDLNRPFVDWGAGHTASRPGACIHCGKSTTLIDDHGRPSHKICHELVLDHE